MVLFCGYAACGIYDTIQCVKSALRVYDTVVVIILATAFIAVQPRMSRTIELSAHDAYLSHKTRLQWTLLVVILVLLVRAAIEFSFAIIQHG